MNNITENNIDFENVYGEELWRVMYGKELKTKKTILEYIDMVKILKKQNLAPEIIQETYNYIYEAIQALGKSVKPNTIMYLQNTLKTQLGKYVVNTDPKEESHFIKFFEKAYPKFDRRKDFTWVMIDIDNISNEQIWHTLTYINRQCIKNNLEILEEERADIIKMIRRLIDKGDVKYINQVKSLDTLNDILDIKIKKVKTGYKLVDYSEIY